jgi:hypothetical protein
MPLDPNTTAVLLIEYRNEFSTPMNSVDVINQLVS